VIADAQPAVQPVAQPPAMPGAAGDNSASLRLVPLKPDEQNQPPSGETEPAVHVVIPGAKK
jgi:hypothetical protein